MKKFAILFLTVFLFCPASYAANDSIYQKIDKSGTINCGYTVWPPALALDPNTKKLSGIFYDIMEEVGKRLNLKINWAQEVGWSTLIEDLKSKKVDMICSDIWANSNRARQVESSIPIYYSLVNVWVRAKDATKFKNFDDLNVTSVSFGHIEGGAVSRGLKNTFPQAKSIELPELNTAADLLEGLKAGKYDFVAIDDPAIAEYQKSNPGTVQKVSSIRPLEAYPDVFLIPPTEFRLKAMIDGALSEMHNDGTIERIVKKYNVQNMIKLPAKPYQD